MKRLGVFCALLLVLTSIYFVTVGRLRSEVGPRLSPFAETVLRVASLPTVLPWANTAARFLMDGRSFERAIGKRLSRRLSGKFREALSADEDGFYRLIFPHTANGGAGGLTIRAATLILNSTGSNATGTVIVRRQDGSDFVLQTNLGAGSRFDFELGPGEILRLETDGTGAQQVGWIEVLSNVPLAGSGTFSVSNDQGFLSEVGIGASRRSELTMLFVDLTDGKNTGYGISNPDRTSEANFSVELRRLDGTLVAQRTVVLAALHQLAEFVTDRFAGEALEGFKGLVLIRSEGLPLAVTTLRTRGVNFTSFPTGNLVSDTSDEGTITLARIGDGVFGDLLFLTSVILMNNSEADTSAKVSLFDTDGDPLELRLEGTVDSVFDVEIPAGTAIELNSDGSTNPGAVGWAQVESDVMISAGAAFTIAELESGSFVSEVGVGASEISSRLNYPARVEGSLDTGIGITNPFILPVNVQVSLFQDSPDIETNGAARLALANQPGDLVAQRTVSMLALSHVGLFLTQLFPDVPAIQQRNFQGRVLAEAVEPGLSDLIEPPLAGLTLSSRIIGSDVFLTSLPAAGTIDLFGPEVGLDLATPLSGASPRVCLDIRQRGEEIPADTSSVEIRGLNFDFTELVEGQQVGDSEVRMAGSLALGGLFASAVTENSADLNTVLTFDGQGDYTPFLASVSSLSGGGTRFDLNTNPVEFSFLPITGTTSLCFDPGWLEVAAGGDISVEESSESFEDQTRRELVTFQRDVTTSIPIVPRVGQAPAVEQVVPSRPIPGEEVTIHGSGFSSNVSGNQVTVEGNSRVHATVLEASADTLRVRLPESARSGNLVVQVSGQDSNSYRIDVPFSPSVDLEWDSLARGTQTALTIGMSERVPEITLYRLMMQADAGEWLLGGLSQGMVVGTTTSELRTAGRDEVFDSSSGNLVVRTATAQEVIIDAIPENDDDPFLVLTLTSEGLRIELPELDLSAYTILDLAHQFVFTEPIFRMPGAGSLDVGFTLTSLPQRTAIESTSIVARQTRQFTVN